MESAYIQYVISSFDRAVISVGGEISVSCLTGAIHHNHSQIHVSAGMYTGS